MKTIFIPISASSVSRILLTDFWKKLRERSDIRIVIFCPPFKKKFLEQEFGGKNVIFEAVNNFTDSYNRLDRFFQWLSISYTNNETVRFFRRAELKAKGNYASYFISRILLTMFTHLAFLRRAVRYLDYRLVEDTRLKDFFDSYSPDAVFAPHAIYFYDRAFIREARRRRIPAVALVHSWDNLSNIKGTLRIHPDVLIVHNDILRKEAVEFCDFPPEKIVVAGIPHFDYYVTSKPSGREEFFKRVGADPKKRLILFSSVGRFLCDTEWQDVEIMRTAIGSGKLPRDLQILVRFHPNPAAYALDPGFIKEMNVLIDVPGVHISTESGIELPKGSSKKVSEEMRLEDMRHFYDTLYYSDVVVTTQSTVSIDASVFDRPVINIFFDGREKRSYYDLRSVVHSFYFAHYQSILKSRGVRAVHSSEELLEWINRYLENPSIDKDGRARIVMEQCWKLDGKAGERIAAAVLGVLDERTKN